MKRLLVFAAIAAATCAAEPPAKPLQLLSEVKTFPCRVVYESFRDGNWELYSARADGSDAVNLTRTADVHELYPHVSPDGTKICFVADRGEGETRVRSLYYMNTDGTGRTLVGAHMRQPCWSPDGKAIAYLKPEFEKFSFTDYATKGLFIYDLATGKHRQHPNKGIHHLYNICWAPGGTWFLATVHAGMGFKHAIVAIEAGGMGVYDLRMGGCRPDLSPDGTQVAWGRTDWRLCVADIDFSGSRPRLSNQWNVVTSKKPIKVYHVDWSPDGKFIAFSRGPTKKRLGPVCEIVGVRADGWNICVADATRRDRWVSITSDGGSNKEPDWAPVVKGK
jgi:Tol biopolymer transport system component